MAHQRILLITTPSSYRAEPFRAAAARLGVEALIALDLPAALPAPRDCALALDLGDRPSAVAKITAFAAQAPLDAIIAIDDSGALVAAEAAAALGMPHNDPTAAEAARDKYLMRQAFAQAGVASPSFRLLETGMDLAAIAPTINYPCVVKPLRLNGSRGVIRANNPHEFVNATARLSRLLQQVVGPGSQPFLVEDFIPGVEVALEGLIDNGQLQVLALFDKPDPLDGPYFEETLYITPSRLPPEVQAAIAETAAQAAAAIGLRRGPLHAELRINEHGPWMVELAGRSIGGLCSRTLHFGSRASLEELIIRQACGMEIVAASGPGRAGGVMMIPIPEAGILSAVSGKEEALAVPGVEELTISAPLNYPLVPLPEGDSYLGFIFARGQEPDEVEQALRRAHAALRFSIRPAIML